MKGKSKNAKIAKIRSEWSEKNKSNAIEMTSIGSKTRNALIRKNWRDSDVRKRIGGVEMRRSVKKRLDDKSKLNAINVRPTNASKRNPKKPTKLNELLTKKECKPKPPRKNSDKL